MDHQHTSFSSHAKPVLRILVADDEADVRDMVQLLLQFEGYSVTVVETGSSAALACAKQDFDLAILDITMPGLDGLQAANLIRSVRRDLKIAFHSALEKAWVDKQFSAYDDFFSKPIDPEEFIRKVGLLLQ